MSNSGNDASNARGSNAIRVGDQMPAVTLKDQSGKEVSLSSLVGRPLVVYFYPANNTPVCTQEACAFRDEMSEFKSLNASVVGISTDSVDSHATFAARWQLPFTLLSDPDNIAREAFGVPKSFGVFAGRVTYVIDAQGIVRHICTSALFARKHVQEARKAIEGFARG